MKERLQTFMQMFEETQHSCSIGVIAKHIHFAIYDLPRMLEENPDNALLPFQAKSFMRRCFRNAIRISMSGKASKPIDRMYADDLAKRAGFHQYKDGEIVSIFDCIEIVKSL